MSCAHDVTKNQRRRHRNLQKRVPGNHERGATGHNSNVSSGMMGVCRAVVGVRLSNWPAAALSACWGDVSNG